MMVSTQELETGIWEGLELSEQNCSSSRPAELGHNGTTGSQQSLCVWTFLQES